MTPQRELIFRSFFELGRHVSVDDVYDKVREKDRSIGYSTVWRNLKLICHVGLAEEVSLGDGITRYDRVTKVPHGHYYCADCKTVTEFNVDHVIGFLADHAKAAGFHPETFKVEIQGVCASCHAKRQSAKGASATDSRKGRSNSKEIQP